MYASLVEDAAKLHGIDPSLLWGVVKTESNFNPNAVNPKSGATGLAQLMPATAKELGVNPKEPVEALNGAAAYLARLSSKYDGDTHKVLAAYNFGEGNVDKGRPLPKETREYIPKVLTNAKGYPKTVNEVDDEMLKAAYERISPARPPVSIDDAALKQAYEKATTPAIKQGSAQRGLSVGAIAGSVALGVGVTAATANPLLGAVAAIGGAGIGEVGQQAYDASQNSAYAPHSGEEALKRVGSEMAYAAAGEVVGAGIRLIKPVMYAKPRFLTPEQQQTKAVLDQHQIPYTPDQITGSTFHNFIRSLADSGTLSEGTMVAFRKGEQDAAIRGAFKGMADEIGEHVEPQELSLQIRAVVKGEDKFLTEKMIDPVYNRVKEALQYQKLPNGTTQGGLLINQKPIKDLFASEVAELERGAIAQNRVAQLKKDPHYLSMKSFTDIPDEGQWNDAHNLLLKPTRETLRKLDNPLDVATATLNDKRVLVQAEKEIEKQLELALQNSANPAHKEPLALWQQAQAAVKDRSQRLRNETINKLLVKLDEKGGDALATFENNMSSKELAQVLEATRSNPALQGSLRRAYIEDKLTKAGGMNDPNAEFNVERFRRELLGKDENKALRSEVLFDKTLRQKHEELMNAVSDAQGKPQSMLGKFLMLRSGGALFSIPNAAIAGLAGMGLVSYGAGDTSTAATELGGALTILVGPKVLAGMLTDPRKVEFMIQGMRYSSTNSPGMVGQTLRVTRELMRLDEGFARAVQAGLSQHFSTPEKAAEARVSMRDRAMQLMEQMPEDRPE